MRSEARQVYREARSAWTAGRKEEAEAGYRAAIEADPSYGYPHYDLALLLEGKGADSAEVIEHYRRFVVLSGSDPRLASQLSWAQRRIAALGPSLQPPPAPVTEQRVPPQSTPELATPAETARCPSCQSVLPAGATRCPDCGQPLEGDRTMPAVGRRPGLPNWAAALLGALAAVVVMGLLFYVLLRDGWLASPGDAQLPWLFGAPTAQPTVSVGATTPAAVATEPSTPTPRLVPSAVQPADTAAPIALVTRTEAVPTELAPTPTAGATVAATATRVSATPRPTATATPTTAPVGAPVDLSGRITFPVFDAQRGTYDIYVSSPDGSAMRRVVEEASQPALSPEGSQLAFRRWKSDDRGIEVAGVDGSDRLRLTAFLEDGLPSWSPDGETLVFFSRRESDRAARIYQTRATGGDERELRRGQQPVFGEYPTWMSDGSIVHRATWPEIALAVMDSDGLEERTLLADDTASAPAPSPDGSLVAFMSRRDGNWEIYRIDVDGTGLLRLTNNGARDGLPAWSPDGSYIAFASERGGSWGLWVMTPNGHGERKLFDLPGALDGQVANEPDISSRGWVEERISWGP